MGSHSEDGVSTPDAWPAAGYVPRLRPSLAVALSRVLDGHDSMGGTAHRTQALLQVLHLLPLTAPHSSVTTTLFSKVADACLR